MLGRTNLYVNLTTNLTISLVLASKSRLTNSKATDVLQGVFWKCAHLTTFQQCRDIKYFCQWDERISCFNLYFFDLR